MLIGSPLRDRGSGRHGAYSLTWAEDYTSALFPSWSQLDLDVTNIWPQLETFLVPRNAAKRYVLHMGIKEAPSCKHSWVRRSEMLMHARLSQKGAVCWDGVLNTMDPPHAELCLGPTQMLSSVS